jgi:hypothetical protein
MLRAEFMALFPFAMMGPFRVGTAGEIESDLPCAEGAFFVAFA